MRFQVTAVLLLGSSRLLAQGSDSACALLSESERKAIAGEPLAAKEQNRRVGSPACSLVGERTRLSPSCARNRRALPVVSLPLNWTEHLD